MCSGVRLCATTSLGRAGAVLPKRRGRGGGEGAGRGRRFPTVFWAWQEQMGSEIPERSPGLTRLGKQMSSAGLPGHAEKLPAAGRPLCGWRSRAALQAGPGPAPRERTRKCAFPFAPAWCPQPRKQAGGRKGVLSHIRRGLLVFRKHALELSERACAIFVRFRIPSAPEQINFMQLPQILPSSTLCLWVVPHSRGLFCGIMLRV